MDRCTLVSGAAVSRRARSDLREGQHKPRNWLAQIAERPFKT